jgi:hypothetical protein
LSAFDLIDHLAGRGIEIVVNGDQLRWRAPAGAMTDDDIALLREHKHAIVAAHRPTHPTPEAFDGWLDEQMERARRHDAFEERAAILEYEAGMCRADAEAAAAAELNPRTGD